MKAKEVHKLSDEELVVETARLRRELYDRRAKTVTEKVENPQLLGNLRRDIARMLTEQRQREIQAKGVA